MKKESKKEQRRQLLMQVETLESEIQYNEFKIPKLLKEIKDLSPTKQELEDGLQNLFDEYL